MSQDSEILARHLLRSDRAGGTVNKFIEERRRELAKHVGILLETAVSNVRVGIVTALNFERATIAATLGPPTHVEVAPALAGAFRVELFNVTNAFGKEFEIALIQTLKMGNNASAIATTALLHRFPLIKQVLLVGIAGGIPTYIHRNLMPPSEKEIAAHVRLGDVIVSTDGVLQYDFCKLEISKSECRALPVRPGANFSEALSYAGEEIHSGNRQFLKWLGRICKSLHISKPSIAKDTCHVWYRDAEGELIKSSKPMEHPKKQKGRRSGVPMVHNSIIGSANLLMKNPFQRDELRRTHGVRAIEMEGSGMADAAWSFSASYLVVRGICDYCDMDKKDEWQEYAAASAAAYTRTILHFMNP
jgi:nucleoside phosphorylase